jgi:hypothetical protein
MLKVLKRSLLVCTLIQVGASAALAEQITVQVDRVVMVTLSTPPKTVVVGNPFIADATVNGNQIFVNGYSAGDTNILLLDESGANIATIDVAVKQNGKHSAQVIKGNARAINQFTYFCTGDTCLDPYPASGTEEAWFDRNTKMYVKRRGLARSESDPTEVQSSNGNGSSPQ